MVRKAEERERRREKNKEIALGVAGALGIALVFDILIFFIAILDFNVEVVTYAFLAVFVIVPPYSVFNGEIS